MDDKNYVYKVVYISKRNPITYTSTVMYFRQGIDSGSDIVLEYKIGKVTKPKIKDSAIYAFDSLDNARHFTGRCIGYERNCVAILKCEYALAENVPAIVDQNIFVNHIRALWSKIRSMPLETRGRAGTYVFNNLEYVDEKGSPLYISPKDAPTGTVMCKWVRPIGIV